jgi:protein-tyrosine-phosphatase
MIGMSLHTPNSLLFLCTGNYYRSRFAEILFNGLASELRLAWKASSRGLALERGIYNVGPMAVVAVKTLKSLGISAGEHFTRFPCAVTSEDFSAAHRVIALKHAEHYPLMQERFPDWADRIEYWAIEDEPGVLPLLEREVRELARRLV